MRRLLYITLFVSIICKPQFCQAEVIVNGDFESGVLDPWVNPDTYPDKWSIDTFRVHSGECSAHTDTPHEGGVYPLMQSFEPVAVDDIVSFSYWFYIESDLPTINFFVGLWFSDGSFGQDSIYGVTPDEWLMRDVMPTIEQFSGKYLEKVGVYDFIASSVWFDDFQIEVIPEPATILLLSLGMFYIMRIKPKR